MFRQLLPAAALLIPLTLGCESGGSKSAAPKASAALSGKQAADVSPSAQSAIPTGVERRYDHVYSYVDEVRSELSDGKAALINHVMRLSKDEEIIFWPIYNEYEDELFALGDQRIDLLGRFVKTQTDQSFDNAAAKSLTDDWFKIEADRLALVRKYHDRIAKELSPVHAAQFAQVEHRVETVIDL